MLDVAVAFWDVPVLPRACTTRRTGRQASCQSRGGCTIQLDLHWNGRVRPWKLPRSRLDHAQPKPTPTPARAFTKGTLVTAPVTAPIITEILNADVQGALNVQRPRS